MSSAFGNFIIADSRCLTGSRRQVLASVCNMAELVVHFLEAAHYKLPPLVDWGSLSFFPFNPIHLGWFLQFCGAVSNHLPCVAMMTR